MFAWLTLYLKFAGSIPGQTVKFFGEKNSNTASSGREVKPWVPSCKCRYVKESQLDTDIISSVFGQIYKCDLYVFDSWSYILNVNLKCQYYGA